VTVTTDASSTATPPAFTANGTAGIYALTASVSGVSSPATFNLDNVNPDAVFNGPSGQGPQVGIFISPAGGEGSITYQGPIGNLGGTVSTLTGLTSLTFNSVNSTDSWDYMSVTLANGSPLLPGPVFFNTAAGAHTLVIDASGTAGGASAALVTRPGDLVVDGQTVLYTAAGYQNNTGYLQLHFASASAVNASVAPPYPTPAGAYVVGYLPSHGTQIPIPMTPPERFVQTLYLDALGRAGSLAEVDAWAAQIIGGGSLASVESSGGAAQAAVAAAIEGSFEARDHLVQTWYSTYLGRQVQGTEAMGWVNMLASHTEEQVLSAILGSSEFYNRAQTLIASGSAAERYIQALYQVLLGRSGMSSEVAAWTAVLPGMGRQGVALAFLSSQEFRTDQVEGHYNTLLHRVGDTVGLQGWVNCGMDIRDIRLSFESGPEFYAYG
jgi:hypothetical protein